MCRVIDTHLFGTFMGGGVDIGNTDISKKINKT